MQLSDKRSRGAGFGGRRVLRFSLRTLFLLTTLIAVWLGLLTKRAREQQLAVDRIAELGGFVTYDFQYGPDGARIEDATPAGWTWLRKIVGDHYFQRVVRIHLDNRAVTDADLQLIGRLRHTTTLALNDTSISDDGISSLSGLSNLRELMLRNTAVDDAAISLLVKFGKLQQLHLDGTRLSGEGLSDLVHTLKATAPSLIVTCDSFDLNGAGEIEFDSPRWDWLAKRTQDLDTENRIKLLDFSHSAASDAHLPPLMGLKNVQMIDFRGS